jgi:hypothetical protein
MGYAAVVFFAMPLAQLIGKVEAPSRLWTHTFIVAPNVAAAL